MLISLYVKASFIKILFFPPGAVAFGLFHPLCSYNYSINKNFYYEKL